VANKCGIISVANYLQKKIIYKWKIKTKTIFYKKQEPYGATRLQLLLVRISLKKNALEV